METNSQNSKQSRPDSENLAFKSSKVPGNKTIPFPDTDTPTNDNIVDGAGLIPNENSDDDNYHPNPDDFDEGDYEDIDHIGEGKKI